MIWLLSTSLMIIAWAVKVSSSWRTNSVLMPSERMRSRYEAPSLPSVAIGRAVPPSALRL